jgi:hypothetical protein
MKKQTYGIAGLLVTLIILAVAGFMDLYQHMNSNDAVLQERCLGLIAQIKQANANWDADILKSYVGIHKDYDALGNSAKEMPRNLGLLNSEATPFLSVEVQVALKELERLAKEKAALTEKFKSRNSILRNSLRYLPTAQEEIGTLIAGEKTVADGKAGRVLDQRDTVNQLVSIVFQYNLFPEERLAAAVQLQNESLRLSFGTMSPALLDKARNLVKHVDVILSERISIALLVAKISDAPITEQLNTLSMEVAKGSLVQANGQTKYADYVKIYATVMVLLFVALAFGIARNIVRIRELARHTRAKLTQVENKLMMTQKNAQANAPAANERPRPATA